MDEDYRRLLERAVRRLSNGADVVCEDLALSRGVPRPNYMTGGYSWDDDYVWDSWANFQWVGFLAGRLWLLHLLMRERRYDDAALTLCERIGPVLARHATVFSSTGIDMYYALTLGHQITGREDLKAWTLAGGYNFANIFDRKAQAFLQIAGADRIVIDTGLNLPSMLWASRWEPERAALAYRHLDTGLEIMEIGLLRADGSSYHAAALHPETRAVTGLFSLQSWSNDGVWARTGLGDARLLPRLRSQPEGAVSGGGAIGRRLVRGACAARLGAALRLQRPRPRQASLRFLRRLYRDCRPAAARALSAGSRVALSGRCAGNPEGAPCRLPDAGRRRAAWILGPPGAMSKPASRDWAASRRRT